MSFYKTSTLKRCFSAALFVARRNPSTQIYGSSSSSLTTVNVDDSGIATLTMRRLPVNSLNLEMLQELSTAVKELEATSNCKGMVLTSDVPRVFCAGLDISSLYDPKVDQLRIFWRGLQEIWLNLFSTKLATVAAVTGHAPAGGCLLALCCDYRIMVGPRATIGLNEVLLGFPAPPWLLDTFVHTIGSRSAEIALSLGTMFNPEEAFKEGVVDELATSPEETVEKAKERLRQLIAIPEHARQATKRATRKEIIQKFLEYRDQDVENYINFITRPEIQKTIGTYFDALKKKKR